VLELVEGETLADVIARGPLALADTFPIARQMTEALEAAHDKGVVHRDLKPANVKVTPDDRVKVLDFGLAKMLESDPKAASLTMSPTLSLHATFAGTILGTAAYMSPEQARGKPVDRRTDVWAFGCVLYEMLTGKHSFEPGETVSWSRRPVAGFEWRRNDTNVVADEARTVLRLGRPADHDRAVHRGRRFVSGGEAATVDDRPFRHAAEDGTVAKLRSAPGRHTVRAGAGERDDRRDETGRNSSSSSTSSMSFGASLRRLGE